MPPAAKAPLSIDDVAALAGVSRKTVSRFLNDSPLLAPATRDKVARVVAETGFVPNAQARGLALGRNFLVALVHDGSDRGVLEAVTGGVAVALVGGDHALVLQASPPAGPEAEAALRLFLARHRPAGVVLLPPLSESEALVALCAAAGVECVRLGRVRGESGLCADDRAAAAAMTAWLVDQGHERIGLVAGPETWLTAQQRELGYLDAMADHGLDRGPALIVPGDNSFASGIAAGRLLLEVSPRPTAILACNDEMAAGVLHAAAQARVRVPEDLSVAGFDDAPLAARTLPPLTTVRVPWAAMGALAARRITAPGVTEPAEALATERVERGSVQPPMVQRKVASLSSLQSG